MRATRFKKIGCLVFIMCHYFLLFLCVRNSSSRCGYSEGKLCRWSATHPPTPETSKHGHIGTSSAFCHCSPSSRSSNYSLQKTSTLLPPRPRYNNTTKLFKETSRITRGKIEIHVYGSAWFESIWTLKYWAYIACIFSIVQPSIIFIFWLENSISYSSIIYLHWWMWMVSDYILCKNNLSSSLVKSRMSINCLAWTLRTPIEVIKYFRVSMLPSSALMFSIVSYNNNNNNSNNNNYYMQAVPQGVHNLHYHPQ